MRRLLSIALALVALGVPGRAPAAASEARVIVSSTLNDELQVFGASSLDELQTPVLSKGAGPVRLAVHTIEGRHYLLAANHGAEGSLGIFDLDADTVTELPLSPFPARPGSVGVAASQTYAYVTNTWQALGGCGLPKGSVTGYDLSMLNSLGVATEIATVETSGAIPYGVAAAPGGLAYASSNCNGKLDSMNFGAGGKLDATRATEQGPDAVLYDERTQLIFVNNITSSSVSVFDAATPQVRTVVPLPARAHPIDANLVTTAGGRHWMITSNGGDDSIGIVDVDATAACIAASSAVCANAYLASVPAGVAGGAPEGIDFDPATGRAFVVNKTPYGSPSLSVVQIVEGDLSSSSVVAKLPLGIGPVPAVTAFDVVVAP